VTPTERFKANLLRLLPIGVGLLLGWLLAAPPAALRAMGPAVYFLTVPLALLLLLCLTGLLVAANLPKDLPLRPEPQVITRDDVRALVASYRSLGFEEAGLPLRMPLSPAVILIPFVHRREAVFGTLLHAQTVASKPTFDFLSILAGGRGALLSAEHPGASALPAAPGVIRQVFAGASVEALFERHREALAFLRRRGVAVEPAVAEELPERLRRAALEQRRAFYRRPLRATLVVLWRSLTRRSPERRPMTEQPDALEEISRLAH
jgi:hypothetical protein